MSDKKYQRFGKYLILDHLVDGGMAKICRARFLGDQANKIVAVKMVQSQFSNDEAFVRMFQDELTITFGMLHPNIMQVYDYGKVNGQLYTAMEYIHGANLKQYLDRLKERKVVFPVEISCYIISQVCLGLHYAHTFTDKLSGKPYNIVHRDISPHNIMLTYDGAVKVIDFGIAKANTNSEATQVGTIKGKISYLAPEYLDGIELDARYDEFAVGITLWEMLCSRKLFQATNDLAVLKLIQGCKIIPPSEINPNVPKELDAIVMKALSKDRSHRYENLDQMNRALVRFLYSNFPEFNGADLKSFAYDLFKNEIQNDQEKFVEYGRLEIQPFIEDMKQEESRTGSLNRRDVSLSGRPTASKHAPPEREKIREIDLALDQSQAMLEVEQKLKDKTATKKIQKSSLQNPKGLSKAPKGQTTSIKNQIKESSTTKIDNRKDQNQATGNESQSSLRLILLSVASVLFVAYLQPEWINSLVGFDLLDVEDSSRTVSSVGPMQPKKKTDLSTESPVSESKGSVILGGADITMEVMVDGERYNYVGKPIEVPLGKEITLSVHKKGYVPFSQKIKLNEENNSLILSVPEMVRERTGLLSTSLSYSSGSKLIYEISGTEMQKELPFKDQEFPVGSYQAKVVNPNLGTEKKVEFSIEENKKHFLE